MRPRRLRIHGMMRMAFAAGLALAGLGVWSEADAQSRRGRQAPVTAPGPAAATTPARNFSGNETVQADVSTRNVAVTSTFSGTEVVIFGAVDNSRQSSAESGTYDIVIVVEGAPAPVVSRRKARVFGIWRNTDSVTFDDVPNFYAQVSTRPADDFASNELQQENDIGFSHLRMQARQSPENWRTAAEIRSYRNAIVRIKTREKLYVHVPYGATFIGRSLFRATVVLPGNAPVGLFETRVYLFREGQLISKYVDRLNLEREGIERQLHAFAFGQPTLYGIATVLLAMALGLGATAIFRRGAH